MMTFPTIAAGTRANEAIGGYANFVAYCNALAAGVDSVTTTAAGAALKANNLSDLASASTARTNLGLGTMATATATDYLTKAGNLTGLADLPTARTNLGLGTAAVADTGTGASNVILGNDARLTDTRTPSAASIVDAMIATTLSPSKITGTAAILGANTFTAQQFIDGSADQIQLRVQGRSTQTSNLQTWEDSAGTVLAYVSSGGIGKFAYSAVGTINQYGAASSINTIANGNLGLAIRAAGPSQTANLQEWQNSSGTALASVSSAGAATFTAANYYSAGLTVTARAEIRSSGASGTPTLTIGADVDASTWTTSTNKRARFASPHYNTSEEPAAILYAGSESGTNDLFIGGGTSLMNAVTNLAFYTAATTTTLTGTKRLSLDSTGNVGIGATLSAGGGAGVLFVANANTAPTSDPTGGGILYVESGALKFRGSSGTITTIAAA